MPHVRKAVLVLVLSLLFGAHQANARPDCSVSETNCGFQCVVFGQFAGYCNYTPTETTGCIQFYGPDCASMQNAYCCRPPSGMF